MTNHQIDKTCGVIRPFSPQLTSILGWAYPMLDHGFIRITDYMGTDESICQAARVSYGRGTETKSTNEGLIRYLMRHRHTTPFEMCEIQFHVKMPIFVMRQWIRHRTANVNEYSARYSILDREFYMPEPEVMAVQSTTNNQGRGEVLSPEDSAMVLEMMKKDAHRAYDNYEEMCDPEGFGLARELARMNLPTSIYTQAYWKIDLHNLLHFLSLRADPHAQYEIRVYAEKMLELIKMWVPSAVQAFEDYQMGALNFSQQESNILGCLLNGDTPDLSNLSQREQREFNQKLDKMGYIHEQN